MKLLVVTLLIAVTYSQAALLFQQEWGSWKDYHGKTYSTNIEEARRQMAWQDNLMYVTKHNMEAAQGKHTYTVDMNQFADLTNQEWRDMLLREKPRVGEGFCDNEYLRDDQSHDAPKKVNWVDQGYVTPIKDQKKCGSCWAFSTTGSLEGQMFAKTGKLVSLSEQNLVDCSQAEGNMGCHGGLMDHGFEYINKNGIETEEDYPYTAVDGHCKYNASMSAATVSGCVDIKTGSESDLQDAVSKIGPISVGIDAGHQSFQLYSEGVYYEQACSHSRLDHGVLVVGYGTDEDSEKDFWEVKNSWGEVWGMKGFIKMSRNRENNCGIATQASYPKV